MSFVYRVKPLFPALPPADTFFEQVMRRAAIGAAGTNQMMLERKTVSIPRACEMVGVSRRTIYNWIAGGKIQYIRTAGGSVRIFADTLWRDPNQTTTTDADWNDRLRRGA
jgi:excisionase family DNA binding protein